MNSSRAFGRLAAVAAAVFLAGCASTSEGPETLAVAPDQYDAAFDAAIEAAREHGLTGGLRDRRAGVIETDARIAGSLLEPWRTDNASLAQAAEHTLSFERRRARFEFTPLEFRQPNTSESAVQAGPELLNSQPMQDLTQSSADLELRVWVYLERAQSTGIRRSTWTRTKTSTSRVIDPDTGETLPANTWVPVRRDIEYERRLLARVADQLGKTNH